MMNRLISITIVFILTFSTLMFAEEQHEPGVEGEFIFTFISSAYYMDKKWGQGMPLDGIKTIADVAHENGVPVTWLVNPRSAEEGKDLFREYHEKYGDAFGHIVTGNKDEAAKWGGEGFFFSRLSYKKLGKKVAEESKSIKESLPWAEIIIGGTGHRSNKLVKVFEKLGYEGMWGHCWEQTLTDDISDRGTPWGFYYVSRDAFKAPAKEDGGLVALEWTARDLNLGFRTGQPEVYSTDPNDVGRAGICKYRDIDYWKNFVDQYLRNTKYNRIVPLVVHQEAHEMECTDKICSYSKDDIESTVQMLDELFKYVKSRGARIVNANDAIRIFKETHSVTPSTYALFDDVYMKKYEPVLVYYDVNGQLFFERGRVDPIQIRNYLGVQDTESVEFAGVEKMPEAKCVEKVESVFECKIDSPERLPYGLAFWGDFKNATVEGVNNAGTKVLEGELVFVSFVVLAGTTNLVVDLNGN